MDAEALEHFFFLNRGDLEMLFGDLSSVISLSIVDSPIHILHASLGDFLLDPARSKEFYIHLSSIHTACMHLCFQHNKQCMSKYFPLKEAAVYLFDRFGVRQWSSSHKLCGLQSHMALCKYSPIGTFTASGRNPQLSLPSPQFLL